MLKLSLGDLWRGLVVAVTSALMIAVIGVLGAVINAPHFDLWLVDWVGLGRALANSSTVAAFGAGSGYLLKNLLTDDQQNFLGINTRT